MGVSMIKLESMILLISYDIKIIKEKLTTLIPLFLDLLKIVLPCNNLSS